MYTDTQRAAWRSQDEEGMLGRVFGYTAASGAVQGYAAGYFLWDLVMSAWYLEIFGPGFLAHAASAVAVYNLGFVSDPSTCACSRDPNRVSWLLHQFAPVG